MLVVWSVVIAVSAAAHHPGTARWGKEPMKLSTTGPENLLPSFFFMAGAEEGGAYVNPGGYKGGTGTPRPFNPPDTCPDQIFDGTMEDLRVPVLPYLEQDHWGCERTPSNVSVIVLENDYLRAAITPQWGGKIWSLYDKKNKKQMFFNNPAHQPENIGLRKAWTSGGCEWNWSPGYIGHSVNTEAPMYAARIPDTPYGDIIRVWEYDRMNGTVFHVDIVLVDDMLWTHAHITNPTPEELKGYWWTCVAMRAQDRTRIVAPAEISITPCVSWPSGAWTLDNTTFRGTDVAGCRAGNGNDQHCAWQQDMSWMGNIPSAHDFFMHGWRPEKKFPFAYITWVEPDGYSVIHTHGQRGRPDFMNGTKVFTWGSNENGRFQCDFLSASDYQNPACEQEPGTFYNYYDPWCSHYTPEGRYTELQIGPAHSQFHTFPVAANSVVQWTEGFKAFVGNTTELHRPAYYGPGGPVAAVEGWLHSSGGIPTSLFAEVDEYLESIALTPPSQENMLFYGSPWGGLAEKLSKPLAPGTPFNQSQLRKDPRTRPWVELLEDGTFSNHTLDTTPVSFMVDPTWVTLLLHSLDAGHDTWLHHLYLGTAALEVGNKDAAERFFMRSLALKGSPHAARNLALIAPDAAAMLAYYQQAWGLWRELHPNAVTSRLGVDLSGEMAIWMVAAEQWGPLRDLLQDVHHLCPQCVNQDQVLHAKAALAVQDGDFLSALRIISSHCFPTYGSDRQRLIDLWYAGHLQMETHRVGRKLVRRDIVALRRRIGCDGDSHVRNYLDPCIRGPPNIGYAY